MHNPRTGVVRHEANRNVIAGGCPNADDITSDGIHVVVCRASGASDDSKVVLQKEQIIINNDI